MKNVNIDQKIHNTILQNSSHWLYLIFGHERFLSLILRRVFVEIAAETSLVNDQRTKSTEPHVSDHIVVTYWHQIVNRILTAASNYFT